MATIEQNVCWWSKSTDVVISCIPTLLGVGLGYWLGLIGEGKREQKKKDDTNAELMRALLQEITTNRTKCESISNRTESTFLETFIWDRVRASDVLYHCITSRSEERYHQLIAVYMRIQNVNIRIGANLSALDGFVRTGGQPGNEMMNRTFGLLREEVIAFLPQLTALEGNFRDFLIAEGFFSPPKPKK